MSRTFDPIVGSGTGSSVVPGHKMRASELEKIRQALDLLAFAGVTHDLGGSDLSTTTSATYVPVKEARTYNLQGSNLGGMTVDLVVFYRTTNGATSVRVCLVNTTDTETVAESTLSAATTLTMETISVTLASGAKDYQLQVKGSNASNGVYAYGYLRIRKIPT